MHPDVGDGSRQLDIPAQLRERLELYVRLIAKWNASINLVSPESLKEIWTRHIADSLQLYDFGCAADCWLDLGSGGGLPGAVVALAAKSNEATTRFALVESDQRKAVFLRTVSRETGAGFNVFPERAELLSPQGADVVSARALAPLPLLCGLAARHLRADGIAIFPKGRAADQEVEDARKLWHFDLEERPSLTDPTAKLLLLRGLRSA